MSAECRSLGGRGPEGGTLKQTYSGKRVSKTLHTAILGISKKREIIPGCRTSSRVLPGEGGGGGGSGNRFVRSDRALFSRSRKVARTQ